MDWACDDTSGKDSLVVSEVGLMLRNATIARLGHYALVL